MTMEGNSFMAYLSFKTDSEYLNNRKSFSDNFDKNNFRRQTSNHSLFAVNETTVKVNVPDEHYQSSYLEFQVMWRCAWYINCVQVFDRHDLWHVSESSVTSRSELFSCCASPGSMSRTYSLIWSMLSLVGANMPR